MGFGGSVGVRLLAVRDRGTDCSGQLGENHARMTAVAIRAAPRQRVRQMEADQIEELTEQRRHDASKSDMD